jgi:hypothetical protein
VNNNIRRRYVTGSEPYWPLREVLRGQGKEYYDRRTLPAIRIMEQLKDRVDQREAYLRQLAECGEHIGNNNEREAKYTRCRRAGARQMGKERAAWLEVKITTVEAQISRLKGMLKLAADRT